MAKEENKLEKRTLRTSSISTIVSIALVLFLLGLFGSLLLLANKVTRHIKENITVTAFLIPDPNQQQTEVLLDTLEARPEVRTLKLITKEEAAEQMKADLGEDFVEFIGYNPLQSSIDIGLNADYVDEERIEVLIQRLKSQSIIEEVDYQKSLVEKVNKNLKLVGFIVLVVCAILLIISLALINNTIRLALYSKRLLIRSMQLVGATRGFIRGPFVWKGTLHGIYGALISCLMLFGLLYFAQHHLPELNVFDHPMNWLMLAASVFGIGILISFLSTYFAVNKFLGQDADTLF